MKAPWRCRESSKPCSQQSLISFCSVQGFCDVGLRWCSHEVPVAFPSPRALMECGSPALLSISPQSLRHLRISEPFCQAWLLWTSESQKTCACMHTPMHAHTDLYLGIATWGMFYPMELCDRLTFLPCRSVVLNMFLRRVLKDKGWYSKDLHYVDSVQLFHLTGKCFPREDTKCLQIALPTLWPHLLWALRGSLLSQTL